jgi:hypothetical protein
LLRAERRRPCVPAVEPPTLVGSFEPAVTEAAEEDALAHAQDRQVDVAIAVDIDRIGAVHASQVRDRVMNRREPERTAGWAVVPIQHGRVAPAGQEQVGPAVTVAIEHRDPTAHRGDESAVVDLIDARSRGLLDVMGRCQRGGRCCGPDAEDEGSCDGHDEHDAQPEDGRPA